MKRLLLTAASALVLALPDLTVAADQTEPKPSSAQSPAAGTVLNPAEQKELQTILESRVAREREYREAVLAAQGAQARFEAANNAAEANFYKLCGRYKLDPDKYEIAADGKSLVPKTAAAPAKKP
jgi:hypothetical protein